MAKPTKLDPQAEEGSREEDISLSTRIVAEAVQEEFVSLPALAYRWRMRQVRAQHVLRLAQARLEEAEVRVRCRIRDELVGKGMAATPAEAQARDGVKTDGELAKIRATVLEAHRDLDEVAALVDTTRDKKDMLISLGATLRSEMESGISINTRKR